MNLDSENKGLSTECPRPKEISDLSFLNTSDEQVKLAHDIWSKTYEQDMITSKFKSPDVLVTELEKAAESTFPMVGKEALKLLDIGAGTGMIGEKLVERGFTNLEAIDLSPKMLAIAEKKNLYQRMVCDSLYNWRHHFAVGQFDIALSCSVFTPGQLKPTAFDEIICLVKPGGLMVHSIREDAYSNVEYGYQSKLKQLEEEGKIKLLAKQKTVKYEHEIATNEEGSVLMFNREFLKDIDLSEGECRLHESGLSVDNPGDNLVLRPLCTNDYDKGFIKLLSQLTKVGDVTREMFLKRFHAMTSCPGSYYLIVIENTELAKIVACGTLVVEQKFIHGIALRGRIESVVVDDSCRGKKIGSLIVETLVLLGKKMGCYKISLDCKESLLPFYKQFGFKLEEGQMYTCKRFYQ